MFYPVSVAFCLVAVVIVYFCSNPLRHGRWFILRRFLNWFPLGMTYAFLYMGRYNLNVARNALGTMITKEDFGVIFGIGTATYAFSFLINGPLVDKIGGKKGILVAAIGAALANIVLGILTYGVTAAGWKVNLLVAFSITYAVNMYFQSYGAVSIIKVKAYWFHVRERGIFGAIFGTLISFGVYFAFDWGGIIAQMSKAHPTGELSGLHAAIQKVFGLKNGSVDATWAVFFIPAAILLFWAALDFWLIKDTPEEAGFASFDTADASSGLMHVEFTTMDLLRKVFTSRLMLLIAVVELTSGVFRNGTAQWYPIFATEVKQTGAEFFGQHWGYLTCVFGILGGFLAGIVSDRLFQSRRGPPAAILSASVLLFALLMAATFYSSPLVTGVAAVAIWTCGVGITSLMSGTAATDFGGRKATATCSGIVDGFAYLGSSIQAFSLGYITTWNWHWWPLFLAPFAVIGLIIAIKIWHALPPATKKYIAEVEQMRPADAPLPA